MEPLDCMLVLTIAARYGLKVETFPERGFACGGVKEVAHVLSGEWAEPIPEHLATADEFEVWLGRVMMERRTCCHRSETICGLSVGYIEDVLSEIG